LVLSKPEGTCVAVPVKVGEGSSVPVGGTGVTDGAMVSVARGIVALLSAAIGDVDEETQPEARSNRVIKTRITGRLMAARRFTGDGFSIRYNDNYMPGVASEFMIGCDSTQLQQWYRDSFEDQW